MPAGTEISGKKHCDTDEKDNRGDSLAVLFSDIIEIIFRKKSLAVIACDGKDNMSIRVPDGFLDLHKSFKIHSKQFVYETLTSWGLNPEKTYSFKGEYLEEQKMVVFGLKNVDL